MYTCHTPPDPTAMKKYIDIAMRKRKAMRTKKKGKMGRDDSSESSFKQQFQVYLSCLSEEYELYYYISMLYERR